MRAAIVRNGIVENIIIASKGFDPEDGSLVIDIADQLVEIGARYDGGAFINPVALQPVPASVTARQARLALLAVGKLDMVEEALAQIPGPEGRAALIEWEYALAVERHSPLIAALGPALGLKPEQIDDLFRAAVSL